MVQVCQDWFPLDPKNKKDRRTTPGFYMDDLLKEQIDVLLKNIVKDWDFTFIISGQGEMRVGKSLLGMQIAVYWTYQLKQLYGIEVPFNVKENMVLSGNELMEKGNKLGEKYKYAVLDYDEAADDLESTKVLRAATQMIKDYLRKAAQYNMLNIIIQSEYFEVPKPIAISRSICLIDVFYTADDEGNFKRGHYNFYSRRQKKKLYLIGKKDLNYNCVKPSFRGRFDNFYPVDEKEYRKEKADSLKRWKKYTGQEIRLIETLRAALKMLYQTGLTHRELAARLSKIAGMGIDHRYVGRMLKGELYHGKSDIDEE